MSVFQGKQLWITLLGFSFSLIFFGLMLYCAWRFFHVTETRDLIMWAMGFGYCAMAVGMLKLYFWMELHKNAVLREIKRVELQLSRLSSR